MSDWEIVFRLAAAAVAGALIGLDRDYRDKPVGSRTMALVSLGAALATVAAVGLPSFQDSTDAQSRAVQGVIQGIMTGVGFIGAGAILRNRAEHEVHGLTTAAAVWVTAAIGIAAGLGAWHAVLAGTILIVTVLVGLKYLERRNSDRS